MWGHGMMGAGHGIWILFLAVIMVVPFWRISQRAGFSGWTSVLILVPLVNLAYIYFLAFAPWPSEDSGPGRDD